MKRRKTIGVMLAQAEEVYQTHLMSGITERAFELDYDCMVFSIPIKNETSRKICTGASNIYRLINFDRLDAVIIVPDTINDKESGELAVDLVRENFDGPVLSVDLRSEFFPSLMTDDAGSIEAICDHMIDEHGCRIIDFMNGIPGHEHSQKRLEGYKRSLEKHGIAFDERRVHDGDFWFYKGEETADSILNCGLPLPQAVVCACDTMAISLCDAFKKRGIRVPEDIAVTGYDSIKEGREHVPSITSAELPAKQTGINAVEYLHCSLENIPYVQPEYELLVLPAQSCGCGVDAFANHRSRNFSYTDNNYLSPFLSTDNNMMSDLVSFDSVEDLIGCVNWYTFQIKPFSSFFLCLNDDWTGLDNGDEDAYRRIGYNDKMHLRLVRNRDNTEQVIDEIFDKDIMLPDIDLEREKPAVYYFTPLNFNDRCFGYTVMKFEEPRSLTLDYRGWIRYVCNGFECMRRQLHIRKMYERLEKAAATDSLTGLYNRNSFNSYVDSLSVKSEKPVKAMFMMADLNYLKTINDTYGHLAGDEALRIIARAIISVCGERERCYRFGGDEFMIIGIGEYTDSKIEEMKLGINKYLSDYNKNSGNPFCVRVSLGAVCSEISSAEDVDGLIRAADKVMYEDKQQSKIKYSMPF